MTSRNIEITIGITAFNEGRLLSEAWESVLNQSTNNWKAVLILDGGADNKTKKIFENINHFNLTKFSFCNNEGAYVCRTKAIEMSNTNWYFHLDADDRLPSNSIQLVIKNIQNNSGAEFIAGASKHFSMAPDQIVYPTSDPELLAITPLFFPQAPIKKELFNKIGGFHIPDYFFHADWDFWLSVYEKKIVGHSTNDIIYERRRRNNSLTWQNLHNLEKCLELIISRHTLFFNVNDRKQKARYDLYEKLARHYKSLGQRYKAAENATKALNYGGEEIIFKAIFQEHKMSYFRYLLRRLGRFNYKRD